MRKLLTVASILLTLISFGQKAQPVDKDKQRLDKVCDTFMQAFSKGQINEAMTFLLQNSVLGQEKIDTLKATIIAHAENVFPYYGKMISAEFILERKIKTFLAKRFYILRFDMYYLRFDFTLYKSTAGWTITSFTFDDGLIELLY